MSRGGLISPGAVFIISCCGAKPINNHYICQNGSGFIVAKAGMNQEEERHMVTTTAPTIEHVDTGCTKKINISVKSHASSELFTDLRLESLPS